MKSLYLALAFFAATLSSCSDKSEDPAPTPVVETAVQARYSMNAAPVSRAATAAVFEETLNGYTQRTVQIMCSGTQGEYLAVTYRQAPGAAVGAPYQLATLTDATASNDVRRFSTNLSGSITKTDSGYSGTFAGTQSNTAAFGGAAWVVSGGSFQNVKAK